MNDREYKKRMILLGTIVVLNAINFILCTINVVIRYLGK